MNKPMREGFVSDEPVDGDANKTIDGTASATPAPIDTEQSVPEEIWPITVRLLHKPIQDNRGAMISELNFREPSAMDLIRAGGNPCRLDENLQIIIDDMKMMRLMSNLCGVMEPRLQRMDTRDYNSCAYRLRSFFLPEAAAWM